MRSDSGAFRMRALSHALDEATRETLRETLREMKESAVRHSSGPYSTKQLRRMDHPYARRHGHPLLDPGEINRQSGMFAGAWRTYGPQRYSDHTIQGGLVNDDPKAHYLEDGTETMFERPLADKVWQDVAEELPRRMNARLNKTLDRV